MGSSFGWVINFSNSIVGVSVLAMPYCFHQLGIILASVMILLAAMVTKKTCEFLLRAASYTRRSTFEQVSLHVFGHHGKLTTELCIIGLLIGLLVAFQVVIGDLAPSVVHNTLGIQNSWRLRAVLMIFSAMIVLPISLTRNIEGLASFNVLSMGFYVLFMFIIVIIGIGNFIAMKWWKECNFWRPSAIFQCLPIISMAFTCQTQVLGMYAALPDPNMKTMVEIMNRALNLVAAMYILIGSFGYFAFFDRGIHGDILENFPHGFFTDGMKLGFWLTVMLSFPLLVFPVRGAINSLLFANKRQGVLHDVISSSSNYIAPDKFIRITIALVFGTLTIGLFIPNVETILSITGAFVGTFVCFALPSALFLKGGAKDNHRRLALIIFIASAIAMILSTFSVIANIHTTNPHPIHDGNNKPKIPEEHRVINPIKPQVKLQPEVIIAKPVQSLLEKNQLLVDEGNSEKNDEKTAVVVWNEHAERLGDQNDNKGIENNNIGNNDHPIKNQINFEPAPKKLEIKKNGEDVEHRSALVEKEKQAENSDDVLHVTVERKNVKKDSPSNTETDNDRGDRQLASAIDAKLLTNGTKQNVNVNIITNADRKLKQEPIPEEVDSNKEKVEPKLATGIVNGDILTTKPS